MKWCEDAGDTLKKKETCMIKEMDWQLALPKEFMLKNWASAVRETMIW